MWGYSKCYIISNFILPKLIFLTSESENKSWWNNAFKSRHERREKWGITAFNDHLTSTETTE